MDLDETSLISSESIRTVLSTIRARSRHSTERTAEMEATGGSKREVQGPVRRRLAERYRLMTLLARGGMGEVWVAWDRAVGRSVAVKRLRSVPGETAAERSAKGEALEREAEALARIDHPNVVALLDCGLWTDGGVTLVMKLVEGAQSLDQFVDERAGELPMTVMRDVVEQICLGLQAIHRAGLVHRDLKPANVLVVDNPDADLPQDRTVHVWLTDFGLTLSEFGAAQISQGEPQYGSVFTIAPEQLLGLTVDHRSDLYSLGCLLFYLGCGRFPFSGQTGYDSVREVLRGHLCDRPPRMRRFEQEIPQSLDNLVDAMLSKDPDRRPGTAGEVRRRLHALWEG